MGKRTDHPADESEALELAESVSVLEESTANALPADFFQPKEPGSIFDEQGRVPVVVIRPGVGKGKGRHLYQPEMLAENAHVFSGWKMFVDHQSSAAKKAAGGLPRSLRDVGGRLTETRWFDDMPADDVQGHEQGAVIGLAKPVPWVAELIEHDPELIESSISANATGVRPVKKNGERVWLVEGIEDKGSLDWVTEAGAGGRVIPLMEAAYQDEEAVEMALLESMSDEDFRAYVRERRPELLEADAPGKPTAPAPSKDKDEDNPDAKFEAKVAEFEKKGMPRPAAVKAARNALSEAAETPETPEGGDMEKTTPEALREALTENPTALLEAVQESTEFQLFVTGLVEAKLEDERKDTERLAESRVERVIALHDMRDEAHRAIAESKLPESWQEGLRDRYSIVEGVPSSDLDVSDDTDDDGNVTKSARAKLAEAVTEAIKADKRRLAEAQPTRIRNQGGNRTSEGEDPAPFDAKQTGWGHFLQENAHVDPDGAYGLTGAKSE